MLPSTILIADDDRNLVEALAIRCRGLGLFVSVAYDARTALNIIFESCPTVACLDVNMPCGNGLCVCEMLASDARFSATHVIVLTGNSDPETVRRCHNLCGVLHPQRWRPLEPDSPVARGISASSSRGERGVMTTNIGTPAFTASADEDSPAAPTVSSLALLLFEVNRQMYAIPIGDVREIVPLATLSRPPDGAALAGWHA